MLELTPEAFVKHYGIALTGGVATGKSTVARALREMDEIVVDADDLSRIVTKPASPGLAAIAATFGAQLLTARGELDRRGLRDLVFHDESKRRQLESILHPLIRQELLARLDALGLLARPRHFFYEAALIIESGRAKDFKSIWVTTCPRGVQLSRLMTREGIDAAKAAAIIDSQLPAEQKAACADQVIPTDRPVSEVTAVVKLLVAALR